MNINYNDWITAFPKTPDEIKDMVEKTVEEQKHKKKRVSSGLLKAAMLTLACVICVGGTAVAVNGLWKMHSEKIDKFVLKTMLEGTDIDGQPDAEEKMYVYHLAYIPEYLELSHDQFYYKDHSKDGASLNFINANKITELLDTFVVDYETTTIGGHKTTLVYQDYLNGATEEGKPTRYYVLFEEEEMLLEVWSGGVPHEDIVKIIEGLSLAETTGGTAPNLVVEREYLFEQKTEDYVYSPPQYEEGPEYDFNVYSCTHEEMGNLHEIGDTFQVTGLLDAKVTEVTVSDSLDLLHPDGYYRVYYPTAPAFDENGKLKPVVKREYKYGDGINTLAEVVSETVVPAKLVRIEVEYTNTSEWDLEPRRVYCHLVAAYEKEDGFILKESCLDYSETSFDYYNGTRFDYEQIYALPALGIGESCKVYWVWAIPEEDLPYLFVGLNNDSDNFGVGGLDEESLEMGLVDIRQR